MDDKKQMLARALEAAEKKAAEAGPGPYCIRQIISLLMLQR